MPREARTPERPPDSATHVSITETRYSGVTSATSLMLVIIVSVEPLPGEPPTDYCCSKHVLLIFAWQDNNSKMSTCNILIIINGIKFQRVVLSIIIRVKSLQYSQNSHPQEGRNEIAVHRMSDSTASFCYLLICNSCVFVS